MGRIKGSKNKVKPVSPPKEVSVIPPEVIYSATCEVSKMENTPSSTGSAEIVTTEKRVVRCTGYVNVQRNPHGSFYLGGDIHETLEQAKAVASKPTVTQIYVAFEVKV